MLFATLQFGVAADGVVCSRDNDDGADAHGGGYDEAIAIGEEGVTSNVACARCGAGIGMGDKDSFAGNGFRWVLQADDKFGLVGGFIDLI